MGLCVGGCLGRNQQAQRGGGWGASGVRGWGGGGILTCPDGVVCWGLSRTEATGSEQWGKGEGGGAAKGGTTLTCPDGAVCLSRSETEAAGSVWCVAWFPFLPRPDLLHPG